MSNMENKALYERFKKLRSAQVAVVGASSGFLLLAYLYIWRFQPDFASLNPDGLYIVSSLLAAFAVFVYSAWKWNCPVCEKSLGMNLLLYFCLGCGTQLRHAEHKLASEISEDEVKRHQTNLVKKKKRDKIGGWVMQAVFIGGLTAWVIAWRSPVQRYISMGWGVFLASFLVWAIWDSRFPVCKVPQSNDNEHCTHCGLDRYK